MKFPAPVTSSTPANPQPIPDDVLQRQWAQIVVMQKHLDEIKSLFGAATYCCSSTSLQLEIQTSPTPQHRPASLPDQIAVDGAAFGGRTTSHAHARVPTVVVATSTNFRRSADDMTGGQPGLASPLSGDSTRPISAVHLSPDRARQPPLQSSSSASVLRRPAHLQGPGARSSTSPPPGAPPAVLPVERQPADRQFDPLLSTAPTSASSAAPLLSPAIQVTGRPGVDSPSSGLSFPLISAAVQAVSGTPQPSTATTSLGQPNMLGQTSGQLLTSQLSGQLLTSQLFGPRLTSQLSGQTVDHLVQSLTSSTLSSQLPAMTSSVPPPVFTDSTTVTSRVAVHSQTSGLSFRSVLLGAAADSSPKSITDVPTPVRKGELMTISISDSVYTARLRMFDTALLGRLILRPGDKPWSYTELRSKLQSLWSPCGDWRMTSLGKGF